MVLETKLTRRQLLASAAAATVMPAWMVAAQPSGESIVPFQYHASDAALEDLRRRLDQTRWPDRETCTGWDEGVPVASLRSLVDYWRSGYNWRRCEADLAQWPQFKTEIDGLDIHFIHAKSKHKNALPIILTHGWPSTILLFREVIGPLTDPTSHGGAATDAFDVVIPSLPGFGFSGKPTEQGWNPERTARAWAVLMQRLGYTRYVAQGGDWGAAVTTEMAQQHAAGLIAIHLNLAQTIPDVMPAKLLPDQEYVVKTWKAYFTKYRGYFGMQSTRPQTVGYALADSPAGQAAWIYDLYNWGTGGTGNPDTSINRDWILDEITVYWLTDTAASSARFYLEGAAMGDHNDPVELPVGVSIFPHDLPAARSWAPLFYPKLMYWHEAERGGHFPQLEVPQLFTEELCRCFRGFRSA